MRAFNRVHSELVEALREREWCGYEPKPEKKQIDCPNCENSVVSGEVGEEVFCISCDQQVTIT